jgi:hypothetical protein
VSLAPLPFPGRTEPIPGGASGVRVKASRIRGLVEDAKRTESFRNFACRLVQDIPAREWRAEVERVADFVRRRVRYTRDPWGVELFTHPARLLQDALDGKAAEDCDGFVILASALLESIGYQTRYRMGALDDPRRYVHIWLEVMIPGEGWVPLELTRDVPLGHDPTARYDDAETHLGGGIVQCSQCVPCPPSGDFLEDPEMPSFLTVPRGGGLVSEIRYFEDEGSPLPAFTLPSDLWRVREAGLGDAAKKAAKKEAKAEKKAAKMLAKEEKQLVQAAAKAEAAAVKAEKKAAKKAKKGGANAITPITPGPVDSFIPPRPVGAGLPDEPSYEPDDYDEPMLVPRPAAPSPMAATGTSGAAPPPGGFSPYESAAYDWDAFDVEDDDGEGIEWWPQAMNAACMTAWQQEALDPFGVEDGLGVDPATLALVASQGGDLLKKLPAAVEQAKGLIGSVSGIFGGGGEPTPAWAIARGMLHYYVAGYFSDKVAPPPGLSKKAHPALKAAFAEGQADRAAGAPKGFPAIWQTVQSTPQAWEKFQAKHGDKVGLVQQLIDMTTYAKPLAPPAAMPMIPTSPIIPPIGAADPWAGWKGIPPINPGGSPASNALPRDYTPLLLGGLGLLALAVLPRLFPAR